MTDITVEGLQAAIIILTGVWMIIFTPISLCYARQLWRLKEQHIIYVTKRHPKVVILSIILFNIWPTIIRPLQEFGEIYYRGIWTVILGYSMHYFIGILCVRFWLLFYDYTYEIHSISIKWKSHLAVDDELQLPWTHRYKWLGNAKIIVAISLLTSSILLSIIRYVSCIEIGELIIHTLYKTASDMNYLEIHP